EAYQHLRRMYDPADPAHHLALRCYAVGDLAEAAVRGGHREAAVGVISEMESVARITPSPALHAGLRYARALLAADPDAEGRVGGALRAELSRGAFAPPIPPVSGARPGRPSTRWARSNGANAPGRNYGHPGRLAAAAPPTPVT